MNNPAMASQRLRMALLEAARCDHIALEIVEARWTPWASVTFSGARHRMTLLMSRSAAANTWLSGLSEHEFGIGGHLVADLTVGDGCTRDGRIEVTIEALTVET